MDADIAELRERYIGVQFDETTTTVSAEEIVTFAETTGESAPRYTDPTHPDFQAPPTWPSTRSARRQLPEDFPRFGLGMDAGKTVEPLAPILPGIELTCQTHIHDIYTKTGRSGRMVFVVVRTEFRDTEGNLLANSDTSIVQREKPA